jgi:hypothetical protein
MVFKQWLGGRDATLHAFAKGFDAWGISAAIEVSDAELLEWTTQSKTLTGPRLAMLMENIDPDSHLDPDCALSKARARAYHLLIEWTKRLSNKIQIQNILHSATGLADWDGSTTIGVEYTDPEKLAVTIAR